MQAIHEGRLDRAVDPGTIGIGERLEVRNRMGSHVAFGEVIANTPFGVALREGGYYERDLYLFMPIEESPQLEIVNALYDGPDARVAAKFAAKGETAPVFEAENLDGAEDGEDDDGEAKGNSDASKATKQPLANPSSSVDVDKLPDDIRKSVIATTQMDAEQLNSVLSEIGDAAVKAMKRVNVKDTDLYVAAAKIQRAVHRILAGASPTPRGQQKTNSGEEGK